VLERPVGTASSGARVHEVVGGGAPAQAMAQVGLLCQAAAETWWVEPFVATLSFAVSINAFSIAEAKSDVKSKRLDDGERDWLYWFGLRPLSLVTPAAGLAYWAGIYVWVSVVSPPDTQSGCDLSFWTLLRLAAELVFGLLAYDAIFFAIHLLMHRGPRWFGRATYHRRHHTNETDLRAMHVLQHSFFDGSLQVLVNIVAQRNGIFGPKMRVARWLHNIIVPYLLTESHARVQQLPVASRFPSLFPGVLGHRQHHTTGGPPFQQFFGYLDHRIFGFSVVKDMETTAATS